MRQRRIATSAFTLLELVLVMAILALVMAIVVPSLSAFGAGRRTHFAATQIVALAKFGRTQAVLEGRTYRLNFDPSGRAAWLTVQNGAVFQPAAGDMGERFQTADGVRLRTDIAPQQTGIYVEFHADGRSDPGHVWISDEQGRSIEVACLSPTEMFHELTPQEATQ